MALRNEQMLARYNLWANKVIYEVVEKLPEAEVMAARQTTFGSILRTLGHSYAVAAIFQAHLERRPHGYIVRNVPDATTFDELRAMQRKLDAWYVAWTDEVADSAMDEPVHFDFLDGGKGLMTRREILLHLVNHTTFHRGFLIDTLRGMSAVMPATDLTVYLCSRGE